MENNWHQQADQLLAESKLVEVLQKYGQPEFTGSYSYDLMTKGDIDIYLIADQDIQTTAESLHRQLLKEGWWNGYMIYNWIRWHRDYFPAGYYVGLQTDFADSRWKVDIWVLNEFPLDQKKYNLKLQSVLNSDNRSLIMKIKEERERQNWPVDGKTIYDAVIEHKVSSITEFKKLIDG